MFAFVNNKKSIMYYHIRHDILSSLVFSHLITKNKKLINKFYSIRNKGNYFPVVHRGKVTKSRDVEVME
jgi:hypothetical protein